MRQIVLALTLLVPLVLASGGAAAEPRDLAGPERGEIRRVIGEQLAAFQRDDGAAAFGFASPTIRSMFGDPDTFMAMVRGGYQPVYRPREVEFRGITLEDGRWVQRVLLVGPDGVPVIARYTMQRQPDGSWLIDGCVLERVEEESV